uniref:UPF3B regulator of nonsense mediated mRNA decay n=1 Tax=Sphenodon punctatus TaxID=8508 RepID=A0A8D0HBK0_SPHPU
MKEDKENTRPKEKRLCGLPPAALGVGLAGAPDAKGGGEADKPDRPKDKKETLSKVVIRRLPPSLTKEQLEEHLQPLPEHDYFEFFANDSSLYPHMFSRAYINFKNQEDIVLFRDRFDGYVFIDHKGQEYPAIVEFAPFQKAAKKKNKKKDAKAGTLDDDPEYKKFLETYTADDEKLTSTPETLLEEIEARNKELIGMAKGRTTANSCRLREEKREERRRREFERKRQREEERRKWKEEERRKRKEAEKQKKVERVPEKDREKFKDEPKIKLLKKPEKDERDFDKKERVKKPEKDSLREEKTASASAKRSDGEAKEEKARKSEDECGKDYREWERDFERDREYERLQREREKLRRQEEERRRQKERFEKEKAFRRKEDDVRKERDLIREKIKKAELPDYAGNMDNKPEKVTKDDKKEDLAKRDRIRNKDRPAMQLYQPGARSRCRLSPYDDSPAKSADQGAERKPESETSNTQEEE